ncbi:hypothetical protein AKJ61_01770 [candidate division MSBL1 archaeon SCGC-AAA259B11]|uniref:Uncharacterized protein n=1 Tax=candidate division MSBL1 archaeon SCGC-AAA259B11 TaxID=1698260 RepID=A0A133U6Z5_9EURY|nr:hypothetical protein AKJ61_01770 [candidate division MSBL1 archaeon SCGC-AAA259B11]
MLNTENTKWNRLATEDVKFQSPKINSLSGKISYGSVFQSSKSDKLELVRFSIFRILDFSFFVLNYVYT